MPVDPVDRTIRLLVVGERDTLDRVNAILAGWHRPFTSDLTDSPGDALARVRDECCDVLLATEVLSEENRLQLIRDARDSCDHLCIVSVRAAGGPPSPEDIRAGADDILRWGNEVVWQVLPTLLDRRLQAVEWRMRYEEIHGRYREIVSNMPAAMAALTPDGTITFVAGPTEELLGVSPEQLVGRTLGNVTGPQASTPELLAALGSVLETGRPASLVLPRRHPDGHMTWWRLGLSATGEPSSREVIVVGQDITEQIAAHEAVRRRTEELDCLYAVTRELHGVLDAGEALSAATNAIQQTSIADAVTILLLSDDAGRVTDISSSGFTRQFGETAGRTLSQLLEQGIFSHAIRSGEPVITTEDNLASMTLHTDLLREQGLVDGVCVPVFIGSRIAALLLVMRRGQPYEQRELALLETLAERVATTAEMIRAHDEVRRALESNNRLLEVSAAINAELGMLEVLRAICEAATWTSAAIRAAISVVGTQTGEFAFTCAASSDGYAPREEDATDALAQRVLREGTHLFVSLGDEDWPGDDTEDRAAVRSAVAVPLLFGSDALGVLSVRRDQADTLTDQDWLALELLASQATLAIRNEALLSKARQSEELYRDLFELSGVPMLVYGRDGVIEMVNRAFELLTGYERDELLGNTSVFDLMEPGERARLYEIHRRYWAGEKRLDQMHEIRAMMKDGETRFLEAMLHRMPSRESVTAVLIDRTEPRQLQRQLIQSEKAAALGQLVSGVAHELNNPLTTILGYAQLLQDDDNPEVADEAALIEREARRSQRIIEGLLSFARERAVRFTPTDVNEAVLEAVRIPEYAMKVDDIDLSLDLAPDLPITSADPHQLVQVFLNIINNAHFAMRGTGGRLSIATRLVEGVIEVEISDSGPGMAEAEARRAFDPFFTTKDVNEGTGMGLSVSEGIVRRHNGSIELQTAPGEGATFIVRLPVRTAGEGEEEPEAPAPIPVAPVRVLVVDDERPLLDLVYKALTALGHTVDTAASARRALSLLEENTYDVILSDLRMPGMSGTDFHRRVLERWPELADSFVIVTGDTMALETSALLKRSDVRVMRKPFTLEQLRALVSDVASSRAAE